MLSAMHVPHDIRDPFTFGYMCNSSLCVQFLILICTRSLPVGRARHIHTRIIPCASIVVAPKKGTDDIRMCVDLGHLNRYVKRKRYQSATPAQTVADITAENAQIFTKIDTKKGYHQCPLDKTSPRSSPPSDGSSSSAHSTAYHQYPFIGLPGFRHSR